MINLNNVQTIAKLDAADRQLCTAIRLFFDDGDSVAVHTLACAAREIYEQHCGMAGVERMLDHIKGSNPDYSQKLLMDVLNAPRNFFKHSGKSLDDNIEFSDEMNDFILFTACHDCTMLCEPNQPAEVQAFSLWYVAVSPTLNDADADPLDADPSDIEQTHRVAEALERLETYFLGLRRATRADQKRAGRWLLDKAKQMPVRETDAR